VKIVAVVHPTRLVAKDLRERLDRRPDLCREVRLLSNDEQEIGQLTESEGGAAFVARLDEVSLEGVELAFLCGEIETDRPLLDALPRGIATVILSRGASEEDGPAAVAGIRDDRLIGLDRVVSPPAVAIAVARLVAALAGHRPVAAEATAILPVSDFDSEGIDELFEETRAILAFTGRRGEGRFPAQIAFNLLPAPDDAELAARQAREALGGEPPVSLQLGRGGVFHGLLLSLHVELSTRPGAEEVRAELGRSPAIELADRPDTVGPVSVAGEGRILVGAVRDGARPGCYWIWAAMDNLVAGGADNAIGLAETLLAPGPPS